MTNSGLVAHAYDLCLKYGITIETDPRKVRQQFGFPEQAPKLGLIAIFDDFASIVAKKLASGAPKQKTRQTLSW